jgi:hypothetical protein
MNDYIQELDNRDKIIRNQEIEIERLRQGLWDCCIITGMDNDGDLTPKALTYPDIVLLAKREVQQLRNDYDEALGIGEFP